MKKLFHMTKNIIMAVAATLLLGACTDSNKDKKSETTQTTSSSKTYTEADGDVKYSGTKVMVRKNGAWVEADEDIKLENGITVYRNGRMERDGYEIELRDGEVVNKTGDFFDRTGAAIANAWDATKE